MSRSNEISEFLLVTVGDQLFGIATAQVETVVACLPVSPLPFVPAFIEGLVNINDRIVPQIGLRQLLCATAETEPGELVLVETSRTPCALRVGRIAGKADVALEALQPITGDNESLPVLSRFSWNGDSALVLDTDLLGTLISPEEAPRGQRGLLGRVHTEADTGNASTQDSMVVLVSGERYAMALTDIVEVLDLGPATPIPGASRYVEGLAMVREEVLLVVSTARLLHLEARTGDERRSVVVIRREGVNLGLRVDGLDGIRQLDEEGLRRIEQGDSEVSGVLADGTDLYGVLTPERLLGPERLRALLPLVPQGRARRQQDDLRLQTVLEVAIGEEAFGIPLGHVRRITEFHLPERVQSDGVVTGAVNIEGRVLPVVDLAEQLRCGGDNEGAWVIVGDDHGEWAIAVRRAHGILDVPEDALELSTERGGFVSAIATVQERLLSLISLEPLMTARQPADPLSIAAHGA